MGLNGEHFDVNSIVLSLAESNKIRDIRPETILIGWMNHIRHKTHILMLVKTELS